jgi:hypothetical protein
MSGVMVFAEYEPHHNQLIALLARMESLDGTPVTALLHHRHARTGALMDEIAAAHGLSAKSAVGEINTEHRWEQADAQHHLSHLVGLLRAAGHPTHGELLTGSVPKVLVREVRARRPRLVLLVTSRHDLAHWARHDLERRIRAATDAEVLGILPA